jgi:hypothetical protein
VHSRSLEHPIAEVDGQDLPAELRHPACELAVPACDLENPFSGLEPKEPFDGGLDEVSLPRQPRFHALVPEGGQLIPGGANLIVQVVLLAHGVERRASPGCPDQERCQPVSAINRVAR